MVRLRARASRARGKARRSGTAARCPGSARRCSATSTRGWGSRWRVNASDEQDLTEEVAQSQSSTSTATRRAASRPRSARGRGRVDYAGVYVGAAGRLASSAEGDRLLLDGEPLEPRGADRFLADRPTSPSTSSASAARTAGSWRRRTEATSTGARERPRVAARDRRRSGAPTRATTAPTTRGTRTSASSCAKASCRDLPLGHGAGRWRRSRTASFRVGDEMVAGAPALRRDRRRRGAARRLQRRGVLPRALR